MADIIPPGFAEVTMPHTHAALGRSAAVVFGIEVPSGGVVPEDLADDIQTIYLAAFGSGIDNQVTVGPAEVRIGQDGGEGLVGVATATGTGSRSGDTVPGNTGILLHKRTNRGGRRGRGRFYVPWSLSEAEVDEVGRVTTTARQSWANRGATMLSALSAADAPLVLLHSVGSSLPGAPDIVTSISVDPVVGTQRRRLGRP